MSKYQVGDILGFSHRPDGIRMRVTEVHPDGSYTIVDGITGGPSHFEAEREDQLVLIERPTEDGIEAAEQEYQPSGDDTSDFPDSTVDLREQLARLQQYGAERLDASGYTVDDLPELVEAAPEPVDRDLRLKDLEIERLKRKVARLEVQLEKARWTVVSVGLMDQLDRTAFLTEFVAHQLSIATATGSDEVAA